MSGDRLPSRSFSVCWGDSHINLSAVIGILWSQPLGRSMKVSATQECCFFPLFCTALRKFPHSPYVFLGHFAKDSSSKLCGKGTQRTNMLEDTAHLSAFSTQWSRAEGGGWC